MARRLSKLTVKLSILGGAVYATADQGLWKDTDSAEEVYNNLYKNICPYFKELPLESLPKIPSTSCIASATRNYYNKGVMATTDFFQELPGYVADWTVQGSTYLYNVIQSAANNVSSPSSGQENEKKEQ